MLDEGRPIGFGGGCDGKLDGGLRLGTVGSEGFAALRFGSGGRLRFGGGGGWLTAPAATERACTTGGGWLGSARCGGGGGPADCGRRTGGGGGPEGRLRGAPTLASAFSGGPELRFAVMATLHRPIGCPTQITQSAKVRGIASLFEANRTPATVRDIGTVVFRSHGFQASSPMPHVAWLSRR